MDNEALMMTIAVLGGTGKEGKGLAYRWAKAGYQVLIGSRTPEKAVAAAAVIIELMDGTGSVVGMSNPEAARQAHIVVLTVPYAAHRDTLEGIKEEIKGKLFIDVTVPLVPPKVTPGWWEGGPQLTFIFNRQKWNGLPEPYQAALEAACAEANVRMLADYDAKNPPALMGLVQQGVKLHAYPKDVMLAARRTAFEIYEEEAGKNPAFKTMYASWKPFPDAEIQWFKVAEAPYQNFLYYVK